MQDNERWKRFKKIGFDNKRFSRSARKAELATRKHAHLFVVRKFSRLRDVRRSISVWISVIILLILTVALQLSWTQSSVTTSAPYYGGTYAEASQGPIYTLNPLYATTEAEKSVARLVFSSLFSYDRTGHLSHDLIDKLEQGSNKKVYKATLKDNLHWSDGAELTSDDIVFTVGAIQNQNARVEQSLRDSWQDVRVKKIDSKTVEFTLPAEYAPFPHALTFPILPKHILQSLDLSQLRENIFSTSPIGSGPFKVKLSQKYADLDTNKKIIYLSQNENYYGATPKISRFEVHASADTDSIIRALENKDVNAAVVPITHANQVIPNRYESQLLNINSGVFVTFNTTSSILQSKSIRKALRYATDTVALKNTINPRLRSLSTPFIDSQVEVEKSRVKVPKMNLLLAVKLFKQSGWKEKQDGFLYKKGRKFSLKIVANKNSGYTQMLNELKKQWAKVGVQLEVSEFGEQGNSTGSFAQSVLQPRAYDVLLNELVIGADPDVFAYWHSSQAGSLGLNFSNYSNPLSDDLLTSARLRSEQRLRDIKYLSFARQWIKDAPAIGIYQSAVEYVRLPSDKSVQYVIHAPTATDRFSTISDWSTLTSHVYKTP